MFLSTGRGVMVLAKPAHDKPFDRASVWSSGFIRLVSAIVVAVASAGAPAAAQWVTHTEGTDAFGEPTIVAADANPSGDALVLLCDRNRLLALVYLMPATPAELIEMSKPGSELPVRLRVGIGGAQLGLDAQLRRWNGKYLGAVAGGRTPALAWVVSEIGAATEAIDVGMDVLGDRQSEAFGSAGSAAAMKQVVKQCRLEPGVRTGRGDAGVARK